MRFVGIDLAWGHGSSAKPANRSGVVVLDEQGQVLDAGWTIGLAETAAWIDAQGASPVLAFVDAPLVVTNPGGQRGRAVSECYPYTTLVGARQFAFRPRPPYKRKPRHLTMTQFWPERLNAWEEIVERLERLATGDPPVDRSSHPATDALRTTPGAGKAQAYKKAEDLLDA